MKRIVLLSVLLAACSDYTPPPVQPDEKTYTDLFPYYIEQCAVSEINKTADFGAKIESGGVGGHSLVYLNGVCRDTTADYPVLKLCDDSVAIENRGVGLSVNAHFKNANWVATQGRDFFFDGTLQPGQGLTRPIYDATESIAEQQGIYDGVAFHDAVYDAMPPGMTQRDYTYDVSIGTDFAPGFARNRFCARTPVSKAQMQDTIRYLNQLNAPYRSGDKDFTWDVFRNNCTHLGHNTLAAAGIWDEWPHHDSIVLAALDFPVPKNEFVNLMRRGNDTDLADLDALYNDDTIRQSLIKYDFLPQQPGVLAEFEPIATPNAVYSTESRLIFYDQAITGRYEQHLRQIFTDPRYTDLPANLLYFSRLYQQIAAARKPADEYDSYDKPGFTAFYDKFYTYIQSMKTQTDADLALIASTQAQ